MKVFIETLKNSKTRTRYNEDTYKAKESFSINYQYPYDYGFIIGTNLKQKDCIDCYILTNRELVEETVLECEPVCTIKMYEDGEIDYKVILKTEEYQISNIDEIINTIEGFIFNIFKQFPEVLIEFKGMLGRNDTEIYIEENKKGTRT